ncbi:MAG: ATP-grasp domain-containing protein [Planctomycetes bacterium]|nr:ATP-grasp domain-containing protein [Planctomycetota bacterium]
MPETLVILGASARAAAFSARRAGFAPWGADLFADADLSAISPARRVARYPAELVEAAEAAPPGPWMFTGALENYPELVDRIAAARRLWGNCGAVLRRVRDPWRVREALVAARLPCPLLGSDRRSLPPGVWMRKPLRSAGGARIQKISVVRASAAARSGGDGHRRGVYYQQAIRGETASGVYVAAEGRARLLGVTRQLSGAAWCGAEGVQYAGSIGPLVLSDEQRGAWRRIGDCLARSFSLVGLFGVDAVVNTQGVFPVEVNPRYTASIEVLERALDLTAIALHARACRTGELPDEPPVRPDGVCGKAILYARRNGPASPAFWRFVEDALGRRNPDAADLPHRGQVFQAGRPVLTLLADGECESDVLNRLQRRAAEAFELLEA